MSATQMTQKGFVKWLAANTQEIVGYAGSVRGDSPIFNYGRSVSFDFGRGLPRWADKMETAYQESIPGRVRGWQALDAVSHILPTHIYMAFYEEKELA